MRLAHILQTILMLLVPVLLVLLSVRLVMTEAWLHFEYQRSGFPADRYGWETAVRLEYGPYGLDYLLHNEDIRYLGDLNIQGDTFTERELHHMEDVQEVARAALQVLNISLLIFVSGAALLLARPATRPYFYRALMLGGLNTLIIAGCLLVLAIFSWDYAFETFHSVFFAEGSWQFYNSDTLIRLYPEQFWFDSAVLVGILTIGGAIACIMIPGWLLRRTGGHD